MLVFDFIAIGNKLYSVRKKTGMTQAQVAEEAGLSDRTYADIERGSVNMRIESFLKICNVLHVTPNEILTDGGDTFTETTGILEKLMVRSAKEQQTAMMLLEVYLQSLE